MGARWLLMGALGALALLAHDAHGKKHAPASAAQLKSPLTAAQMQAGAGRAAYERACGGCHGLDGKAGTPAAAKMKPKPTNLADGHMDSLKDGEMYWVITNGIGKQMPGFAKELSETERWQIVSHVRAFRTGAHKGHH